MNLVFVLLSIIAVPLLDYLWEELFPNWSKRARRGVAVLVIVCGCVAAINQHIDATRAEAMQQRALGLAETNQAQVVQVRRQTELLQNQLDTALGLAATNQTEVVRLRNQADTDTTWLVHQIARAFSPDPAAAAFTEGLFGLTTGRSEEAETSLKKAVRLNPTNSESLNNLGLLYKHKADYETARRYYSLAYEANPANASAAWNLAIELDRSGAKEQALKVRKSITNYNELHDKVALQLAQLLAAAPENSFWGPLNYCVTGAVSLKFGDLVPIISARWKDINLEQRQSTTNWNKYLSDEQQRVLKDLLNSES